VSSERVSRRKAEGGRRLSGRGRAFRNNPTRDWEDLCVFHTRVAGKSRGPRPNRSRRRPRSCSRSRAFESLTLGHDDEQLAGIKAAMSKLRIANTLYCSVPSD